MAKADDIRIQRLRFKPGAFVVHPSAHDAYDAWLTACPEGERLLGTGLLTDSVLADAWMYSPLPVMRIKDGTKTRYGVVGRFYLYHQITETKPPLITLAVIVPGDTTWNEERIRALSQALLVIEAGGRAKPTAEFRALYDATRHSIWPALRKQHLSRRAIARVLVCSENKLQKRR